MKDSLTNVVDREIFFTKLIKSVSEFYDKDYAGHSTGIKNLHIMVLLENYEPERFKHAQNLSIERKTFLNEIQVKVEIESTNYLYFL